MYAIPHSHRESSPSWHHSCSLIALSWSFSIVALWHFEPYNFLLWGTKIAHLSEPLLYQAGSFSAVCGRNGGAMVLCPLLHLCISFALKWVPWVVSRGMPCQRIKHCMSPVLWYWLGPAGRKGKPILRMCRFQSRWIAVPSQVDGVQMQLTTKWLVSFKRWSNIQISALASVAVRMDFQ